MHVLCESHQSQQDSLSLSSTALTKHDLQTCCRGSTVGNPMFCTEHKHPHFWTNQNQRQTQGGLTDVLCWCVSAGGQPGGWNHFWTVWCINKNQSQCATVKLVYAAVGYMKGRSRGHFDLNPIILIWKWDSTQRVRCCVCTLLLSWMTLHWVCTWCHSQLTRVLLQITLSRRISRKGEAGATRIKTNLGELESLQTLSFTCSINRVCSVCF